MPRYSSIIMAASLASVALAKTDLSGCTSTDVSSPAGASIAYYVPGTGELCEFLDCGGGRAPPNYSVPGCPQYTGTASYSPSYLPGYGSMTAAPSATATSAQASSSSSAAAESYSSSSSAESASHSAAASSSSASASAHGSSSAGVVPAVHTSTGAHTTTVVTSTPVAGGSNGTTSSGSGSGSGASRGNGTNSASPTPSGIYDSGAEKVWFGSAALLALGAVVAAL